MKYEGLNIMKKRFLAALLCLCLLVGLVPGMGTTAFAASDHNISEQAIALVIRLPHTAENTISTIDEANAAATKQRYSCDKSGI